MPRKRLSSELRKEQILDATLQIISESGLPAVNTSEIARRVGIVPSALYRHFKDMESLIDALLDRTLERLIENMGKVTSSPGDLLSRLRQIFLLHLQMLRRSPGISKLVFSDAVAFGLPRRREKVFSIVDSYMQGISSLVLRGQEQGQIERSVEPRAVAFSLVSLAQNVGIMLYMTSGKSDFSKVAESAWSIFESGLTAREKISREV